MVTKFSPDGSKTRGTINNCAHGTTPWGTYLTCEENWAGYFRRIVATDNPNRTAKEIASFARYGVAGTGRELWATVTPDTDDNLYGRWNAMKLGSSADGSDDYRNVANTFGWVVEIDPFNPHSTPRKRTALGRIAREGAWLGPVKAGEPLVWYMGDDSRNEYIYKYVSNKAWNPRDANGGLAAGDKYLDDGRLYVAQFLPDGSGQWVELKFGINGITPSNPAYAFADQADVLINARLAADAAGATKMDRPEWGAVHPKNGEVYFTLTNNAAAQRPIAAVDAANPRFYNDKRTTGHGSEGQSERSHHPLRRGRRLCRRVVVHLGCLPVRRACECRSDQRQHLGADGRQRLFQPGRPLVQLRQSRSAVDPDGRWRLYGRNQLHAPRGHPGRVGDGEARLVTQHRRCSEQRRYDLRR